MKTQQRMLRGSSQAGQAGLISLLVVMLIIGVLAEMYYPKIAGRNEYAANGQVKGVATPIDRAYDTGCTIYMEQVSDAAFQYRQDHGTAPPDLEALKPYGVDQQIIDTPNCNFGIPKAAPAPQQSPGSSYAYGAQPQTSNGYAQPAAPMAQPGSAPPGPGAQSGSVVVGGIRVPTTASGNDLGDGSGQ